MSKGELRVYRNYIPGNRLRMPPPEPPHSIVEPPRASAAVAAATRDAALIDILTEAAASDSVEATFARKERRLREVFASLDPGEAKRLHARLVEPRPSDAVAAGFARLAGERRQRLLRLLADRHRP
jgi:hypothetical protein